MNAKGHPFFKSPSGSGSVSESVSIDILDFDPDTDSDPDPEQALWFQLVRLLSPKPLTSI